MYLIVCLLPFHLVLFLEISFVLSFVTCVFVSRFWLFPCIYFYLLGRAAMSPRSGWVRILRAQLLSLPGHQSWALYGQCALSCYSWEANDTTERNWPQSNWLWGPTAEELLFRRFSYGAGLASVGLWCSLSLSFEYAPKRFIIQLVHAMVESSIEWVKKHKSPKEIRCSECGVLLRWRIEQA